MEYLVFLNIEYLFYQVYKLFARTPKEEDLSAQVAIPDVPTFDASDVQDAVGVAPDAITLWDLLTFIVILVSLILFAGIVFAIFRMSQIRTKEKRRFQEMEHEHRTPKENEQWNMILAHAESNDPKSWKVALEESDLLLANAARDKHIPRSELDKYREWQMYTGEHSDEVLTKGKMREALEGYEKALKKLHVL